jgi:hypothetical protein
VSTFTQAVTIGPDFFSKSFNDYRDKFWAFAREIMQNSLDCGSTEIHIRIAECPEEGITTVIVRNDGEPMSKEILVGKLLSLGSSGKDFQGAVGGFGKAKEILYFAHKQYKIHSGVWFVEGQGAGYNLYSNPDDYLAGTRSVVAWDGLVGTALGASFRRFIDLCGRREVSYWLDEEQVRPKLHRLLVDRPLVHDNGKPGGDTWANLGVCRFEEHLLLVRIGGIPMFCERSDYKRTIVLELQGNSGQRLTANRDSLRYPFSTNLRDLITQLAVDRRSALKREEPVYTRYGGPKLQGWKPANTPVAEPVDDSPRVCAAVAATVTTASRERAGGGIQVVTQGRAERTTSLLWHEFITKNCVNRRVPREYDPLDVRFSNYSYWLARAWSGCLVELHAVCEEEDQFSVGFVFSDEVEAEYEKSKDYGRVYFVNPCVMAKRSLRRRFRRADRGLLVSLAAHEFVHGGLGLTYHGEDFAGKLTDVMGTVFKHWRRFSRHLK